jgi:O-antigen ligase
MERLGQARRATTPFGLGLGLVALYFMLRTLVAPDVALAGWTVAAGALALASPLGGLTIVAAIAPFTEALTDDGRVTAMPVLLGVLGLALVLHIWRGHRVPRLNAALMAAGGLFVVTLIGVLHSALTYGADRGLLAFEGWVPGVGGGLTALFVAAWLGCQREVRPLVVACGAIALAAALSVADFATRGGVELSPVGWLVQWSPAHDRLQGIIAAPNAAAAIFLVGLALTTAMAVFGRRTEMRALAAIASAGLLIATLLTLSRSALLALLVVLAILGWRLRRWLGAVMAALALSVTLLLNGGVAFLREVPAVFDAARVDAWRASLEMWQAAPLTGRGFRSFEWLHQSFGSALDAPHNEWLRLFAEEGILGGLLGLFFVVATLATLLRARGWLSAGIAAAAAALFVMACFNNPFIYVQVTAPAFLVIGTGLGLAIAQADGQAPAPSAG